MKHASMSLVILLLVAALAGCGKSYSVTPGFKLEANDTGYCRLVNVEKGKELYSGRCTIRQVLDGDRNKYVITMGSNEPLTFIKRGRDVWEHVNRDGRNEPVRYRDRGQLGIFRWEEMRLEVDEFN
jgi:hypothetical protein